MGHNQSTTKQPATASPNFSPDVEVIQAKSHDAHYGEIKVVRDKKTKQTYFLKEIVVNTKQAFDSELAFYSTRVGVKHPNVVSVIGYTSEDKHNFCSTYYKISVFIEILEHDLLRELEGRKANRAPYGENELLLIASDLISALSYFQSQGHSHGDIRPFNIFVRDRVYKLSDPSLSPQKGSNGLTLAAIQGTHTLLAPEWLKQVPIPNLEIKGDRSKADVYSLGATLLSLATLQSSEEFYDYKNGQVNQNLINDRLEIVRSHYSDFTYCLIRDMLIHDAAHRPEFVSLSNRLLPFQNEIRTGVQLPLIVKPEPIQPTVIRTGGEVQKKAAPVPVDIHPVSVAPVDDLDARIKAALERSAATFRAVEHRDYSNINYSTPATYTAPVSYTNTYIQGNTVTAGDYTPSRQVEVVKSSRPVETHVEVTPSSYTATNYANVYTTEPQSYTSTYVAPVSYTSTYVTPVVEERVVKSSQVYHEPAVSNFAYTTTPQSYTATTYTPNVTNYGYTAEYTTPAVNVASEHIRNVEERVVKSAAPQGVEYNYTTYTTPASYTATSYGNGVQHIGQPDYSQYGNVEVSHVVNRVGGDIVIGNAGEPQFQRVGGQVGAVEYSS